MEIKYFSEIEPEHLIDSLITFSKKDMVEGIFILACDNNNYKPEDIDKTLQHLKIPVFGGIFPAIIYNNKKYDKGYIIASCNKRPEVNTIENISSEKTDFESEIFNISNKHSDTKTMFIFIDGFSNRIGSFIENIFTVFGLGFNYIGGGAGSLSLKQKPCIFTNKGLKADCAITAGVQTKTGIGVKHGWKTIDGPFKITDAEKTILKELDFKPAFNIYKEVVESHSKRIIDKNNFFEIARAYPFGINKIDAETVVRDPLLIGDKNSLICVGEVQTGSYVNILTGNKNTLINAAGEAIKTALFYKKNEPQDFIFFIDCISRVLFLDDEFNKELEEVSSYNKKVPLFGALTIGEIANNGKDYLEFYNKTAVIGCF